MNEIPSTAGHRIVKQISIGFAGAVGGVFAALADMIQKREASAISEVDQVLERVFETELADFNAILLVISLATALSFIFEPETKKKAFYTGAAVLALLMTVVPYNPPKEDFVGKQAATQSRDWTPSNWLRNVIGPGQVSAASPQPQTRELARVFVSITTSDHGDLSDGTATLIRPDRQRASVVRFEGNLVIFTNVEPGSYSLRLESPGYKVFQTEVEARADEPKVIVATLERTVLPLTLLKIFGWTKAPEVRSCSGPVPAQKATNRDEPIAEVVAVQGEVCLARGENWVRLSVGEKLSTNELVRTGQDGHAAIILLSSDTVLNIGSHSEVEISIQPKLHVGDIWIRLHGTGIKIETPAVTAAIRG